MNLQATTDTNPALKPFTAYLTAQNYSKSTIVSYTNTADKFIKWCKRNHTTPKEIDYKKSIKYIKYLSRKAISKRTINSYLKAVKIYFNYLIDQSERTDNPIENTTIRGEKRTLNYNLLSGDELEDLYYSFESKNTTDKRQILALQRDKIIIGLMIYQGLNTTNLGNLKLEHLALNKGKIYVPRTRRSNARTLELKAWQIIGFMNYINEVRPQLQKQLQNFSEQLFTSNARFNSIVYRIMMKLKQINQKVNNNKQIRASVITNWLGHYDLRKTQYLAGHRYISSTERYLQDDLENLHEMINNFHPIS